MKAIGLIVQLIKVCRAFQMAAWKKEVSSFHSHLNKCLMTDHRSIHFFIYANIRKRGYPFV